MCWCDVQQVLQKGMEMYPINKSQILCCSKKILLNVYLHKKSKVTVHGFRIIYTKNF